MGNTAVSATQASSVIYMNIGKFSTDRQYRGFGYSSLFCYLQMIRKFSTDSFIRFFSTVPDTVVSSDETSCMKKSR